MTAPPNKFRFSLWVKESDRPSTHPPNRPTAYPSKPASHRPKVTVSTNQLLMAIWAIVLNCTGVAIWIAGAQAVVLVNIINDINDYGEGDSIPFTAPILIIIVGVLLQVAGVIVAAVQVSRISRIEEQQERQYQESKSRARERALLKEQPEKEQIDKEIEHLESELLKLNEKKSRLQQTEEGEDLPENDEGSKNI